MDTTGWIILVIANLPVFWLLGWIVFREWDEFVECLRFWITPDIISLFRGEYWEDWWAEMKLFMWLALCAITVSAEYALIARRFLPD